MAEDIVVQEITCHPHSELALEEMKRGNEESHQFLIAMAVSGSSTRSSRPTNGDLCDEQGIKFKTCI